MTFDPGTARQGKGYQSGVWSLKPKVQAAPRLGSRQWSRRQPDVRVRSNLIKHGGFSSAFLITWPGQRSKQCAVVCSAYQWCCNKWRNTQADLRAAKLSKKNSKNSRHDYFSTFLLLLHSLKALKGLHSHTSQEGRITWTVYGQNMLINLPEQIQPLIRARLPDSSTVT